MGRYDVEEAQGSIDLFTCTHSLQAVHVRSCCKRLASSFCLQSTSPRP